jgi:thiamine-phosphate pyrophosphorylase
VLVGDTMLITDGRGDPDRVIRVVAAALAGGVRGVQVREPSLSAREVCALCEELKPRVEAVGGELFVNDRVDVVAAGYAHGVQLGYRSLRPVAARRVLPASARVGYSVHDLAQIREGEAADFFILAPLFPTGSKPGVEPLGLDRAGELVAASPRPVVLLGGIDAANARSAREIGASGVAVMRAVCDADDPRSAAAALVATRLDSP